MHRSGTSLVAMTMEAMGLDLGDHSAFFRTDQWNSRGYFERRDVIDTNSRLITGFRRTRGSIEASCGHVQYLLRPSMHRICEREKRMTDEIMAVAEPLAGKVVKDPRFCLTWPIWAEYVSVSHLVLVLRHPSLVVDSLWRRQRIPHRLGFAFWRYHIDALRQRLPPQRTVVHLEALLANPHAEIEALRQGLSLPIDIGTAVNAFENRYSAELLHTISVSDADGRLDRKTLELWHWLLALRSA
jgi:hypothetical protein